MKNAIALCLLLAAPILGGCKATIETELTVMDLLFGKTKTIPADFSIEVADCQGNHEANPLPGSLKERQQIIAAIFHDAEFKECSPQGGGYVARFSIPITIDKDRDGVLASEDHINLVSSDKTLLIIAIPAALKERIERLAGADMRARAVHLDARIRLVNDHGNNLPFQVFSVYVDNQPYVFGDVTLPKGGTLVLRLSDVAIDSAIEKGNSILMMK